MKQKPKYATLFSIFLLFVQHSIDNTNLNQELTHLTKHAQLLQVYHSPHIIYNLIVSISPIPTQCNTTLQKDFMHVVSLY